MAQLGISNSFQAGGIRAMHGSTAFADSEQILAGTQSTRRTPYFWWTVWTAVSGEDFNLQYRGNPNSAPTASLDFIVLLAINLSHDVTENTDWVYAERATDDALTTTPLAGASITFTPSSASDWLVFTNGQYTMSADTISYISKMERSGEASSSLPEARREMIAAGEATRFNVVSLARVFALGSASNTFAEYGSESAVEVTRLHSRVFALNLDKFRNHAFAYTEADASLSATNYATLLQTLSITPDVTGDVWVGGYFGFDVGNVARILEYRIHRWTLVKAVDGVDDPAGQTTANYQFKAGGDATDEMAVLTQAFPSLTAATAYTFDLDASSDSTTGSPAGQHRSLWSVTMELAGGGTSILRQMLMQ